MKQSINIQRRLEDELYEPEELQDLLYTHWVLKMKKLEDEKAKQRQDLWNLFFFGNLCFLHDKEACYECSVYGRGICPSAREEARLPHDF